MRIANSTDKNLITEILISAFSPLKEDNSINLVIKQDEKRTQRMRILMKYLFEKAIDFGEIYISDNHKTCILLNIQLAFKCIGIERIFNVLKRQRITKHNYPKEEKSLGFPIYFLHLH